MANAAGEFNRVDRDGDTMEGPLTMNPSATPANSEKINWLGTGTGYVQIQGNDLGWEDPNSAGFIKFNDLAGAGGLTMCIYKKFTATPGQVLFDVTPDTYPTGVHAAHVFVDGVWLSHDLFTETSDHEVTITGLAPLVGGETVVVQVFRGIPAPGSVFQLMVTGTDTTPHYLNNKITVGPNMTKAVGTPGGAETLDLDALDEKVAVSATDTTPAGLEAKTAQGTHVTLNKINSPGNEQIEINAENINVKASATDTTEGYLYDKITVDPGLTKSIDTPAGNEKVKLTPNVSVMPYTPGDATDWNGAPPATLQAALDRLAAAFKDHTGGAVP